MPVNDDLEILRKFISGVKKVIDKTVKNASLINPAIEIEGALWTLLQDAWESAESRFEGITTYMTPEGITPDLSNKLSDNGLTGDELKLKMSIYKPRKIIFDETFENFLKFQKDGPGDMEAELFKGIKREKRFLVKKILCRLLIIINKILESLKVIPGVEAIKEIKDTLEDLLDLGCEVVFN